jgi:hypothetical protein
MRSRCRDALALALLATVGLVACEREGRRFESWPPSAPAGTAVREVELQPGPPTPDVDLRGPYEGNAFGVS